MIILEENFKWHLKLILIKRFEQAAKIIFFSVEAFASELFIWFIRLTYDLNMF